MAGLQSFLKSSLFLRSSHAVFNNVIAKQSYRANHILSPASHKFYLNNLKVVCSANLLKNSYRLSSTSDGLNENFSFESNPGNVEATNGVQAFDAKIASEEPTTEPNVDLTSSNDASLSSDIVINESLLPPVPTELTPDLVNIPLTNPTLTDLGLCSWWPTGRVQRILEILHIDFNLPWWEAVVIAAFSIRILTLPLNIVIKRRSNHFANHMPKIQEFQSRIQDANVSGNYYEAAKVYQESMEYFTQNNIQMTRQIYPMIVQSFIFVSVFWGLRQMANLPVETLKTGGLWWFTDLTLADPYYILPALVSTTLTFVLKAGVDGNIMSKNKISLKLIQFGIPALVFPFLIFSPAVMQIYWITSNFVILLFTLLLKIRAVSNFLKIPVATRQTFTATPGKRKKNLLEEIKEQLKNYKMHRAIMEREQLNAMNFQKAGKAPAPRTFTRDPTKKNVP